MVFDPLSLGIGGAGLVMDWMARQDAKKQAEQNLAEQRARDAALTAFIQNNARQQLDTIRGNQSRMQGRFDDLNTYLRSALADEMGVATAGQTDAYGNKYAYNPATKSWDITLAPGQKEIQTAGEAETRRGLTEDASRNRRIRAAAESRGQLADSAFRGQMADFSAKPKSEATIFNEIATLMALGRGQGNKALNEAAARYFDRTSGNQPFVVPSRSTLGPGQIMANDLLSARSQALSEYMGRESARNSSYLPRLQALDSLASGGVGGPMQSPDVAATPSARADALRAQVAGVTGRATDLNLGTRNQQTQIMGGLDNAILQALQNEAGNYAGAFGAGSSRIAGAGGEYTKALGTSNMARDISSIFRASREPAGRQVNPSVGTAGRNSRTSTIDDLDTDEPYLPSRSTPGPYLRPATRGFGQHWAAPEGLVGDYTGAGTYTPDADPWYTRRDAVPFFS